MPIESFACGGLPLHHAAEARGFTGEIENFGPLDGERKKANAVGVRMFPRRGLRDGESG